MLIFAWFCRCSRGTPENDRKKCNNLLFWKFTFIKYVIEEDFFAKKIKGHDVELCFRITTFW